MIVVIGDSIAYGQLLPDRSKAWPHLLRGWTISVSACPGDTTRIALERFPQFVQELEPAAVIIQFGHNDCNRWQTDRGLQRVSDRAFMANLEEMVDRCRAFGAMPFLCSLTPSYKSAIHASDTMAYDGIIREVAHVNMVSLIDVRLAFTKREYVMEDGLHLTELGHTVYAEVVQQALEAEQVP